MKIKLSKFAKENSITYKTAYDWVKTGRMPYKVEISPSGSIFVLVEDKDNKELKPVYIYCRVSSHDKKDDLERQISRCKNYIENKNYKIEKVFKEIGSGMNDNRTQLCKLFEQPIGIIVIENKDRLTRFGFNYIKTLYTKLGGEIIIINNNDTEENDLMKDLISIITSFCCRLYGMRRGYNKAKYIQNEIKNN